MPGLSRDDIDKESDLMRTQTGIITRLGPLLKILESREAYPALCQFANGARGLRTHGQTRKPVPVRRGVRSI